MSRFMDFCRNEIERAGLLDADSDYGGMLGEALLELAEVFDRQGHSGYSASIVNYLFNRLAEWNPITPLTGEDDEWVEMIGGIEQNKRCPGVIREKGGVAYQVDYYVFKDENGGVYVNKESRRIIDEFPYVPGREYIEGEKHGNHTCDGSVKTQQNRMKARIKHCPQCQKETWHIIRSLDAEEYSMFGKLNVNYVYCSECGQITTDACWTEGLDECN